MIQHGMPKDATTSSNGNDCCCAYPTIASIAQPGQGMNLVAIDTMHLFPTTLTCADLVQKKYGKKARPTKSPSIRVSFAAKDSFPQDLPGAEFRGGFLLARTSPK